MKEQNIKIEIHKVIDMLPDDISKDVLDYLKSILEKSSEEVRTSNNVSKIINEDKNLLDRLAK
jgi:predicted flavoprotein YhiN